MSTGIKETKEAAVGLIKLAAVLGKVFKDGVQATDVALLLAEYQSNPELKAALDEAFAGIQAVPEEIKDINFSEGVDLSIAVIKEIPGLISSFSK